MVSMNAILESVNYTKVSINSISESMKIEINSCISGVLLFVLVSVFISCLSSCKIREELTFDKTGKVYYADTVVYYKSLRLSYVLNTSVDYILNGKVYQFVDEWMGVPFGVSAGVGLDNGRLVQLLYQNVYDITIPNGYDQLVYDKRLGLYTGKEFWAEGDLLFFEYPAGIKSSGDEETYEKVIGVYLINNRFLVNCKRTGRVSIERIDDDFWKRYFKFAGRCK